MQVIGKAAVVFSVIAIFIPVAGIYLTAVAALLAVIAAGPALAYAVLTIFINLLNISILSPSLGLVVSVAESENPDVMNEVLAGMGAALYGTQAVAIVLIVVIHIIWRKKKSKA